MTNVKGYHGQGLELSKNTAYIWVSAIAMHWANMGHFFHEVAEEGGIGHLPEVLQTRSVEC